jgi:catechol 2,3-dioxygenase-like lactoylglutathione lyase family enzyme
MLKGQPVPILRIFDVPKALDFYVGFLGFAENWRHHFDSGWPLYIQVSRDGVALHLSEHHGDASPGAGVRIEVEDVERYCADLLAKSYPYCRPSVTATEWKTREMAVLDPFRNRLLFWTPASSERS